MLYTPHCTSSELATCHVKMAAIITQYNNLLTVIDEVPFESNYI